jgi:RNA polymerase sigma-70 factor (ECF subfamily)
LAAAFAAAREEWPGLQVDRGAFERHLADVGVPSDTGPEGLAGLHVADLYLACACATGVPGALEAFEAKYLRGVGAALRLVDTSEAFADEVTQQLRERLFVTGKLATYSGRGSLGSWISIVAQRLALTMKRREAPRQQLAESAMTAILHDYPDAEIEYLKARYGPEFQEAVEAAFRNLSPRDRIILRLATVKGVTHVQIGKMYSVHQSTVSRWVAVTQEQIRTDVRRLLQARLALASDEVESLVRYLDSDLHLSMSRLLGESSAE